MTGRERGRERGGEIERGWGSGEERRERERCKGGGREREGVVGRERESERETNLKSWRQRDVEVVLKVHLHHLSLLNQVQIH